jgi:hypothetical protein
MAEVILRSPFTGEAFPVPPEYQTPAFIEALIRAGFVQLSPDDAKKTPKKK